MLESTLSGCSRDPNPASAHGWLAKVRAFAIRPPLWLTLVACVGILVARKPDAFLNPQFWAEDGVEFYLRAYTHGTRAFLSPYASYLHTIPRLVAAFAVAIDPRWAPTIFVTAALAFTIYVAARTQSSRCPLPRHVGFAFAVVLVPDAWEVLLNIANLQWVLAAGFLLVLISADPHRWWQYLHDGAAVLLFGLTGPFSIMFAPLFVWRAWQRQTRASWVLTVLAGIAGAVQAWNVWHYPPGAENPPIATGALLAAPGLRVAGSLLAGFIVPVDFHRAVGTGLAIVTMLGVATLAARRGGGRIERIWLALAFAGLLVSALYRCRSVVIELCQPGFGARYFFPLQLIVIWLVLAATADERRRVARAAAITALWMLAVNLPRLRDRALTDLHWADYVPQIRAGEAVSVPVNPAPWVIDLPARRR